MLLTYNKDGKFELNIYVKRYNILKNLKNIAKSLKHKVLIVENTYLKKGI